jgi:hypothetical protein
MTMAADYTPSEPFITPLEYSDADDGDEKLIRLELCSIERES